MILIVGSFFRACHLHTFYTFFIYSCLLLLPFNKCRKCTSHNKVTFIKVHFCYQWKSNFYYIHSATKLLCARKKVFTGIHESRIHHDSVWNPLPFAPHPLSAWNEMCLKLKWNASHAATVGPPLPLFLVWNRYTIFPPDLFCDLHCSFHAEQQLLWTVWVCHSSQMILSFCLKLALITKVWF